MEKGSVRVSLKGIKSDEFDVNSALVTVLLIIPAQRSNAHRQKIAGVRQYARMRKWNVQTIDVSQDCDELISHYVKTLKPSGAIIEMCAKQHLNLRILNNIPQFTNPSEECDRRAVMRQANGNARLAFGRYVTQEQMDSRLERVLSAKV